jgi:hypothetical protein
MAKVGHHSMSFYATNNFLFSAIFVSFARFISRLCYCILLGLCIFIYSRYKVIVGYKFTNIFSCSVACLFILPCPLSFFFFSFETESNFVIQAGLDLVILLSQPSEF